MMIMTMMRMKMSEFSVDSCLLPRPVSSLPRPLELSKVSTLTISINSNISTIFTITTISTISTIPSILPNITPILPPILLPIISTILLIIILNILLVQFYILLITKARL